MVPAPYTRPGPLGSAGARTGRAAPWPRPVGRLWLCSGPPWPALSGAAAALAAPPRSRLSHPHPGTDTPTAGASSVLTPSCSSSSSPSARGTPGSSFFPAPPLPAQAGLEKHSSKATWTPALTLRGSLVGERALSQEPTLLCPGLATNLLGNPTQDSAGSGPWPPVYGAGPELSGNNCHKSQHLLSSHEEPGAILSTLQVS